MHVQHSTVDEAITEMNQNRNASKVKGNKQLAVQPLLFRIRDQYFVKADSMAIAIPDISCFAEAVEFLFMCFYVFSVSYPSDLRFFYGFLENVMRMKMSVGKSTVVSTLLNRVNTKLKLTE